MFSLVKSRALELLNAAKQKSIIDLSAGFPISASSLAGGDQQGSRKYFLSTSGNFLNMKMLKFNYGLTHNKTP